MAKMGPLALRSTVFHPYPLIPPLFYGHRQNLRVVFVIFLLRNITQSIYSMLNRPTFAMDSLNPHMRLTGWITS
ncbi:UNVERIFIED_CONTAM: hypothetical protein GTU68_062471 [Idotea baltica]|nr:hypothetical protein [Idotea baltica]